MINTDEIRAKIDGLSAADGADTYWRDRMLEALDEVDSIRGIASEFERINEETDSELTERARTIEKLTAELDELHLRKPSASGYAGVMPNGNIVDRRENPSAIPIQASTLLGVPEPAAIQLGRKGGQANTERQQSARSENLKRARERRWSKKTKGDQNNT